MMREMADHLGCPDCKTPLELRVSSDDGTEITAGSLVCGKCKAEFPIIDGLPHLLPAGLRKVSPK